MHRFLAIGCTVASLILVSTESWGLPRCPGSYDASTWSNCSGTHTFATKDLNLAIIPRSEISEFIKVLAKKRFVEECADCGTLSETQIETYSPQYEGSIRLRIQSLKLDQMQQDLELQGNFDPDDYDLGFYPDTGKLTIVTSKKRPTGGKYVGEWKDGKPHGQGVYTYADGSIKDGVWEHGEFFYGTKVDPPSKPKTSTEIAKAIPDAPTPEKPSTSNQSTSGSGFFVSKLGHIVTNAHVVKDCVRITVGDSSDTQSPAEMVSSDSRNDLALLKLSSLEAASSDSKSLIKNLGISIVPLAANGLLRSNDVELAEKVMAAGYPYGDIFSNSIKVTRGIVSATRGVGDDPGQFQLDAAIQTGNSGGPIYDENGNIVGVVVAQLNKLKVAKMTGSLPENVNFGIKASTVRQFLTSSGLPSKQSSRSKAMPTTALAKIAQKQTVMVLCYR